jgi:hypothetical protein
MMLVSSLWIFAECPFLDTPRVPESIDGSRNAAAGLLVAHHAGLTFITVNPWDQPKKRTY